MKDDPFTGTMFVFRARWVGRLKIPFWDGTGLVMVYKSAFTLQAIRDGLMSLNRAQLETLFVGLKTRLLLDTADKCSDHFV